MSLDPEEGETAIPVQPVAPDRIGVNSSSETVAVYQLAARWSERYAKPQDDLHAMLERFRQAYVYLDAVTHGLEPPAEQHS